MQNIKLPFALLYLLGANVCLAQLSTNIASSAKVTIHGGSMSVWGDMNNSANSGQAGMLTVKDGAKIIFYGNNWANNNASDIDGDALLAGEVDFVNPRPAPYAADFTQNLNGGGEGQSFPSLRISNALNVNLVSNSAAVRGTLAFAVDDGHIVSNGNSLIVGGGQAAPGTITGYGPLRYFITNLCGLGHFVRTGINNNMQVFPVGLAENDYTPASVLPANPATRVSVNVCNYALSPGGETALISSGINRTWNIFSDAEVNSQVTLQHNTNTNNTGVGGALTYADENAFIVFSSSVNTWESYVNPPPSFAVGNLQDGGAPVTGSAMHTRSYVLATSGNAFPAYFTKDFNGTVLPASGIAFTGRHNNGNVVLNWSLLSEYNLSHYDITRSIDGNVYNAIGKQPATNRGNVSYSFSDDVRNINSERLFYRLKMADKDGSTRFSNVVLINLKKKGIISVYPNPASSVINISLDVAMAQRAEMVLFNLKGQAVKRQRVNLLPGSQTVQLKGLETLSNAQYELMIVLQDGSTIKQKIIVLR